VSVPVLLPELAGPRRVIREALRPATSPFHVEDRGTQRHRRVEVVAVSLVGTVVLGFALGTSAHDRRFDILTLALALVWVVGAAASGPLHLGHWFDRREVALPALLGAASFGVFVVGDLVVRQVPTLHQQITEIITRADTGSRWLAVLIAVLNGIGEEVFFRGAVYSAFGRHHPALWSTVVYVAVTAAALNVTLVLAAAVMGTLFALERRATRGILAPTVTHITWSVLMIFGLPR